MKAKPAIPVCILSFLLLVSLSQASSVTRSLPSTAGTSQNVVVNLTVSVTGGATYYAIDETYPSGWTLISAGGGDTNQSGHIKWIVTQGATNTVRSYTVRTTSSTGTYTFSGIYMFENMTDNSTITGANQVQVGTIDTTPPNIGFANPTPSNNTNLTQNYIFVNASISEAPGTCLLNWYNGTWINMTMTISGQTCYRNMTSLEMYLYQFRVYANDATGNLNVSAMRQNRVFSMGDITSSGGPGQDGCVNILDLSSVAQDFGKTSGFINPNSDINKNGVVDIFDVVFIGKDFNKCA